MKLSSAAILIASLVTANSAFGFTPSNVHSNVSQKKTQRSNSFTVRRMSPVSDAEELLRKARELRQQAEGDERTLQKSVIGKKETEGQNSDRIIEEIFPANLPKGQAGVSKVADILEQKRFSVTCLTKIVERLHEREIAAKGIAHVNAKFEKVADLNEQELQRLEGLIQLLIDAAQILDDKVLKNRDEKGTATHHVDSAHWGSGNLSDVLTEKAHFLGREHDEQFKGRLEQYYEAARKKEGQSKSDGDEWSQLN